jgi:hypothetical protein
VTTPGSSRVASVMAEGSVAADKAHAGEGIGDDGGGNHCTNGGDDAIKECIAHQLPEGKGG